MLRRVVKISSQLLSSRNPLYVHQDAREISNIPYRALVSLSSFSEREGGSNTWAFWLGLTGEVYLQFSLFFMVTKLSKSVFQTTRYGLFART